MELKVVCDCGQKYKFDIEPVNGRMPMTVNCPACGVDGTASANDLLAQHFPDQTPPIPVAVAVETAAAMMPPPPPIVAGAPAARLRINRAAPAPMAATAGSPPSLAAPELITSARSPALAAAPKPKAEKEYSLGLGIVGAILGAALGAGLMYGFFAMTDFRFPLMGTGIGVLTGLGARILGRGTDTSAGIIAGAVALVATAGTLYLIVGDLAALFFVSMAVSVYFAYRIAG